MAELAKKGEEDLKRLLSHEIRNAIAYDSTELSDKRARVLEYIQGEMRDTPSNPNRSSVVTKDTKDIIHWILPGVMRVFRSSGQMFEYEPQQPEDEDAAKQASDYLNLKFDKNGGYKLVYNAAFDAMAHSYAIIKTWWDDTEQYTVSSHTGLDEMALTELISGPDIEVLSQDEKDSDVLDEMGQPIKLYDVKIKRLKSKGRHRCEVVSPENFLMHKDDIDLIDPRFVCHRDEKTRSELIEMGFDRAKVMALTDDNSQQFSEEELARLEDRVEVDDSMDPSTELIEIFECYLKADMDGDGVSENVKAYYAGAHGSGELLDWEIVEDDHPFDKIDCFPMPHRFDGMSIADDTMDLERIKTVLTRQMLDNLYAVNNPQKEVEEGSVINKDALINPKFGQPIIKRKGSQPIIPQVVPFIGDKALAGIAYIDEEMQKRTGVSKMAMALDAEALQNQSATANQNAHDASRAKQELLARNMAEGWASVGKKLLRLYVKHQDRADVIRLRGGWVQMDPRHWNAEMDCVVNVGLGTGSKDRDMMMLNQTLQHQYTMAAQLADRNEPQKALEYLPKIVKTLVKIGEAAGLRNADDYHIEFSPEDLQRMLQVASQPQPDPKAEAEKAKLQAEAQKMQFDMQAQQQKAQMDAQLAQQKAMTDTEQTRQKMEAELMLKREQLTAEMQLKREQLSAELQLKREQMQAELQIKRELGLHATNVNGAAKVATSGVHMGGEPG